MVVIHLKIVPGWFPVSKADPENSWAGLQTGPDDKN